MPPDADSSPDAIAQAAILQLQIDTLKEDVQGLKKLYDLKTEIAVIKTKMGWLVAGIGFVATIAGAIVSGVFLTWQGS